jgi:hypothetical protein
VIVGEIEVDGDDVKDAENDIDGDIDCDALIDADMEIDEDTEIDGLVLGVPVKVGVVDAVRVPVGVGVSDGVRVAVTDAVAVIDGDTVGVNVGVTLVVEVSDGVTESDPDCVGVIDWVIDGVTEGVGDGDGSTQFPVASFTYVMPVAASVLQVQLVLPLAVSAGSKFTHDVHNPCDLADDVNVYLGHKLQ